jgi:hypothetical protein
MSGFDIDRAHDQQVVGGGYQEDLCCTIGDWRTDDGLTLTASTAPELQANTHGGECLKWDHGDTTTDGISCAFRMPAQYDDDSCDIRLCVDARKIDATADENADLKLAAIISWDRASRLSDASPAGSTVPTLLDTPTGGVLATAATAILAACDITAATTNRTGWGAYEINLGKAIREEVTTPGAGRPKPGDRIKITLYPHEAVGSTDMDVQIGIPCVRVRRHGGIDPARRNMQ